MKNILHDRYYNIGSVRTEDKYLVQTRSQSKSSGIKLPEAQGVEKRNKSTCTTCKGNIEAYNNIT